MPRKRGIRRPSPRATLYWLACHTGRTIAEQVEDMAEARLLVAVIDGAARDLCADPGTGALPHRAPGRERIEAALRYFAGADFARHCDLLGLDAAWVRGLAYQAAERSAGMRRVS
jgi:hypothetical protein